MLLVCSVCYSSCWMSPIKGFDDLDKLVHHFLWFNWDGRVGFKYSCWTHCIELKDKGGLGILVPKIQGVFLATKWII